MAAIRETFCLFHLERHHRHSVPPFERLPFAEFLYQRMVGKKLPYTPHQCAGPLAVNDPHLTQTVERSTVEKTLQFGKGIVDP